MTFSFSTLHQYEQCPYAFYEKKIENSEINEGNFFSDIGSFMHDVNAKILDKSLMIEDAIEYYIDNYENYVVYTVNQSIMEKKYNQGIDYLMSFNSNILKNYEILGVEKKVNFKIENYKFVGYIDLLLRNKDTKEILLVDHKSTNHFLKKDGTPLKDKLSFFETYSNQMYLYSKAVYEEYGEFPKRIIWNHFFEQAITNIPFDINEYKKAIQWALDVIKAIYKDSKFNANKTYMMCNVLCGYRNSCYYAMEETG